MTTVKDAYQVVMPKLGLIMEEAQLVEWHKQDQEWVEKGELLFSLESDKSIIDIEAPSSGYLSILIPAGETVEVKKIVALLTQEKGQQAPGQAREGLGQARETGAIRRAAAARPRTAPSEPGIKASPKARAAARKRSIPLLGIEGTGPRGMIVTADLDQTPSAVSGGFATPVAEKMALDFGIDLSDLTGTGPGGRITRADLAAAVRNLTRQSAAKKPAQSLPLEGLRGIIAERLSASWVERPQVTLYAEVDAQLLIAARKSLSTEQEKISYNAFLILAAAQTLAAYPGLNVQLTPEEFRELEEIHIGLAVDTERGLMVPVIKYADTKPLQKINQELTALAARTLEGKLLPDEYSGGTFTITNLGGFGVDAFSPIINPPESAILGVGKIKQIPVVEDGKIVVGERMILSLSFDHRVMDGAPAAQFFQHLCQLIESPGFYAGMKQ